VINARLQLIERSGGFGKELGQTFCVSALDFLESQEPAPVKALPFDYRAHHHDGRSDGGCKS
jgi:hypothetical protein